jgi:hypothetical protein
MGHEPIPGMRPTLPMGEWDVVGADIIRPQDNDEIDVVRLPLFDGQRLRASPGRKVQRLVKHTGL